MVEKLYREAAVERAMTVQEVLMRAMAKGSGESVGTVIESFIHSYKL